MEQYLSKDAKQFLFSTKKREKILKNIKKDLDKRAEIWYTAFTSVIGVFFVALSFDFREGRNEKATEGGNI